MPVSATFRVFVVEQLDRALGRISSRAMFGGVGLYHDDLFFGLIDDDVLYLKVDGSNRGDFEAIGSGPFRPGGAGGEVMQYYELPADVLEDTEALREWVRKAIAVAQVARRKRKPSSKRRRR